MYTFTIHTGPFRQKTNLETLLFCVPIMTDFFMKHHLELILVVLHIRCFDCSSKNVEILF